MTWTDSQLIVLLNIVIIAHSSAHILRQVLLLLATPLRQHHHQTAKFNCSVCLCTPYWHHFSNTQPGSMQKCSPSESFWQISFTKVLFIELKRGHSEVVINWLAIDKLASQQDYSAFSRSRRFSKTNRRSVASKYLFTCDLWMAAISKSCVVLVKRPKTDTCANKRKGACFNGNADAATVKSLKVGLE